MPNALTRWLIFLSVAIVPIGLVVAPIASFLVLSFFRAEKSVIVRDATLANYASFFSNWTYAGTFLGTLALCFQVMLVSVILGYPIAWFIWQQRGSRRYLLLLLAVVPLFMSYIVKLYTLRSMLGLNGLVNQLLLGVGALDKPSQIFLFNQRAVLITMVVIYLPFVILPIFLALERIPKSLLNASIDLGAGAWDTFRRIVLPLSLPAPSAARSLPLFSHWEISSPRRWWEGPRASPSAGSSTRNSASPMTGLSAPPWRPSCLQHRWPESSWRDWR